MTSAAGEEITPQENNTGGADTQLDTLVGQLAEFHFTPSISESTSSTTMDSNMGADPLPRVRTVETTGRAKEQRVYDKWQTWKAEDGEYEEVSLTWIMVYEDENINKGSDKTVIRGIYAGMSPQRQERVSAWIEQCRNTNTWSFEDWIKHTDACFLDKDARQKAKEHVFTVRQGEAQTLASFRHVFERHCSRAKDLAPTGASKVHTFKAALNAILRQALAVQIGLSETNYEDFTEKAQILANQQEALDTFTRSRGSKVEYYANNTLTQRGPPLTQRPTSSHTEYQLPADSVDAQGDTIMGGLNTVQVAQIAALVAAFKSTNHEGDQQIWQRSNGQSGRQSGGQRKYTPDTRPYAPVVSEATIAQRRASGACLRCGKTPSHPYGQCMYRAAPDQRRPANVNHVETRGSVDGSIGSDSRDSGN